MIKEHKVVKIEKLDHFGRGISHIEKKPIFIPYALKDEIVEIEIQEEKKNFLIGSIIKKIEETKDKIDPPCPYFRKCGGCHIMHLEEKDQLIWKEQKVKEVLKKFASLDEEKVVPCIPTNSLNYRNKVIFHVEKDKIGFYEEKSHELVPISSCMVLDPLMNHVIERVKEYIKENQNLTSFMIRVGSKTNEIMLALTKIIDKQEVKAFFRDLNLTSLILNNEVIEGKEKIEEELLGRRFKISKDSFFQVNNKGAEIIYSIIEEEVKKTSYKKALDLYCGTGSIGIIISPYVEEVIGIEVVKEAIDNAIENAKINKVKNIHFLEGKVEKVNITKYGKVDLAIVDPPRSGLDQKTITELKKLSLEKLIYVSCNVVTLARDLSLLKDTYEIEKVIPTDMFPNTYHVECLSVLTRRK